jgi:hypothetical protein
MKAATIPNKPLEIAKKAAQRPRFLQPMVATTSAGIKARNRILKENISGQKI